MKSPRVFLLPSAAALLLAAFVPAARADLVEDARAVRPTQAEIEAEPANLSGGLRQLSAAARKSSRVHASAPVARAALSAHRRATASRVVEDTAGRLVVDVRLRPGADPAAARAALENLGAEITAEGATGRHGDGGILSARLAPEHAAEAAAIPGVHSVSLIHKPWRRVGRVTSQGVANIHSDVVNANGITGRGITVGVLSDSYDLTSPHAVNDVISGDLPNRVNVLQEASRNSGGADEGRAMLQIVHDVAPDANLAFATTGDTQTSFANNIRALRTQAGCDVLVDDIGFPDEPFFSDSIVARAVDQVVTSTTMAGRPVAFYSAAGNEGGIGYESDFSFVSDADVRAPGSIIAGNLKLDQVDPLLTGGWQNFKGVLKGHGKGVVQKLIVSVDTAEIDLQWNDLPNSITNDYKLLIFDVNGNFLADLSDTSNAFSTGDVYKFSDLDAASDGSEITYQIAITRRQGSAGVANHLRYEIYTNGFVQSKYLQSNVPTIFGHSGARQVDAVGAVPYDQDQRISEDFSSLGPVSIYFDDSGNRLTTPELRLQPTISGPDNVDTTFFPAPAADNDTDGDGFPNFAGTSAAAPHVAAAAALLLQAAGGPGSLSAAQLRGLFQSTAGIHDQSPFQSAAVLGDGLGDIVTLKAAGDGTNSSSYSTRFFTLSYDTAPAGSQLLSLSINLAPTKEIFDPSVDLGFNFTIGSALNGVNGAGITETLTSADGITPNTLLTLTFAPGAFPSGGILQFGIDRDDAATNAGGNSADLLAGATVKVKALPGTGSTGKLRFKGSLQNDYGTGYSTAVGSGLINVSAAVDRLRGQ